MLDSTANQIDQLAWFIIPEFNNREHTFLDIADIGYRENTISAIYAYFLTHKNSDISQLFIETLVELIQSRGQQFSEFVFEDDYICHLEYITNKSNRIDILIESTGSKEKTAIIIENKIFHVLANDLHDYWSSVIAKNKAGVLLTLRKENIKAEFSSRFVNITHSEWCNAISAKGIPISITPKEFIYLTDFLTNMSSIVNSSQSEEARFFFDHSEKILRAVDVRNKAWNYIIDQLKHTASKMDFVLWGGSGNYRHIWDAARKRHVYYAVVINEILTTKPQIMIILEVYKDALKIKDRLITVMNENNYFGLDLGTNQTAYWAHIASKTYQLKKEDCNDLSNFLFKAIETDFSQAMNLMIKEIHGE
jgi:hypothetical protein